MTSRARLAAIHSLDHFALRVPDLKVAASFYEAFGLSVARVGEAIAVFGLQVGVFHYIPGYLQKSQKELLVGTVYAAGLLPLLIGFAFTFLVWFLAPGRVMTVVLFVFSVVFWPVVVLVSAGLGLGDTWFDWRRASRQRSQRSE